MARRLKQVLSASQATPTSFQAELSRLPEYLTCSDLLCVALDRIASEPRWPVYLWGFQGRGKTIAAKLLMKAHKGPAFGTDFSVWAGGEPFAKAFFNCSELIKGYMDEIISGKNKFRAAWRFAPIAVMDDIGTRGLTDNQFDALLQLINVREGRPTVFTSNLSPKHLGEALKDVRIGSRVSAGFVVEVTGIDRRGETREILSA